MVVMEALEKSCGEMNYTPKETEMTYLGSGLLSSQPSSGEGYVYAEGSAAMVDEKTADILVNVKSQK